MLKKKLAIAFVVLFLSISIYSCTSAKTTNLANTIYVDDDNTEGPWDGTHEHPYQFIQDGIDNASEGDTVFVSNGTYCENVVISKSITLVGENKDNTLIDSGGSGDVVYVSADNVNITGFRVRDGGSNSGDIGIELHDVQNCHIENNTINPPQNGNYWIHGIRLSNSSNCTVTGNTVNHNWNGGIELSYSSNCNIINNTISNSDMSYGIELSNSSNCTVTGNTVENGIAIFGGLLEYWNTHTIDTSNTVNGKPVYYWKNIAGGTVPAGAAEVILANCTGVTVENQDVSKRAVGIELGFSSNCNIINNTILYNRNRGIRLSYSSNCTITGNTVNYNVGGIELSYSSNCTITGNTVSYNGDNTLFVDGFDGIYLLHSSNCTITGNTISNNHYWDGIFLRSSSNIIIKNCNIYSNGGGISLRESLNTQIHYCNIYGNQWSGVSNAYSIQYQADARWCWWGCIIGPTRLLKLNPFRRRDTVSGNVLFRPWLYHYQSAVTNTKSSQMSMDLSLWFNIDWFPAKEPYNIPIPEYPR